jgi:hypothetical protein
MSLTSVVKSKADGHPIPTKCSCFPQSVRHYCFLSKCDVCTAVKTKGQQILQHLHSRTAWVYTAKTVYRKFETNIPRNETVQASVALNEDLLPHVIC